MKLRTVVALYVAFRKSAGADFRSSERLLATFCRASGKEVKIAEVSEEQVAAFLCGNGTFTRYWHRKHSALLGFYRYAVSRGYVERPPLPTMIPKQPPAIVPYIFTVRKNFAVYSMRRSGIENEDSFLSLGLSERCYCCSMEQDCEGVKPAA